MVKYHKYIDFENIERYLIFYNNKPIILRVFNLRENHHANLLHLKVNYCTIYFDNFRLSEYNVIHGITLSSLYEKDAIKICDYLNSICTYNRLNKF